MNFEDPFLNEGLDHTCRPLAEENMSVSMKDEEEDTNKEIRKKRKRYYVPPSSRSCASVVIYDLQKFASSYFF